MKPIQPPERRRSRASPKPRRRRYSLPPPLPVTNYSLSSVCPACGSDTFRLACKVRCPNCGFTWDCSEL